MVSQEDILQMAKNNGGSISLTTIRKHYSYSGGNLTRQLRRLEEVGYIKIHRDRPGAVLELLVDEWEEKMVI